MSAEFAEIGAGEQSAVVFTGDYLNKVRGEQVERECRTRLSEGCEKLILNFSQTELVNSVGVSILLGIIDTAANRGAKVVFSDVKPETAELFAMLGVTKHVEISA